MATEIKILQPMTRGEVADSCAQAVSLRLNMGHRYLDRGKVGHARVALADALVKLEKIDSAEFPNIFAQLARGCVGLGSRIEDF